MKTTLFILTLLTVLLGCKDSPPPDCGCESESLYEIPTDLSPNYESLLKSGLLFFNKENEYGNGEYVNRFWIFPNAPDSYVNHLIICEDQLLLEQFGFLKNTKDSIFVNFRGGVKKTCFGLIALPANYSYNEIVLEEIYEQ